MAKKLEKDELTVACSPFLAGDGMGQNPMGEQAKGSLEQYSQTFGKYLSEKDGEKKFTEEERLRRERAKKANRIYKQVCEDMQLNACFFNNFGDWSEYVEGKMSDAEFQGLAITRAQKMVANQN